MKKLIVLVLALVCVLGLVGCNQLEELRQGDNNTQYFFTAKVIEVNEEYLVLEVFDTGNTNLSDGTLVNVSTEVIASRGCPEFSVDECARVLMARNIDDKDNERLKALSIYKTDETGKVITDSKEKIPSISDISQMKYSEVNEALSGKDIQVIREAWGEPVESDDKEDVWQLDESMLLFITYNDTGIIESCELVCGTPLAPAE